METIILDDDPQPDTESTIAFNFFDPKKHDLLGGDTPEKQGLEGKITFNPNGCQIFSLPPLENAGNIFGDRYLIHIRFTLHEVPERGLYERVKFQAVMEDQRVIASDLFPDQIIRESKEKFYSFSTNDLIAEVTEAQQVCRRFCFRSLSPTITAFGEGDSFFFWVYSSPPEEGGVKHGGKHGLVVLQVPHNMLSVVAEISMETTIARQSFRKWRSEKRITNTPAIIWDLTQALPFCPDSHELPEITHLPAPKTGPIEILFAYAREDEKLRDELEKYLSPLKNHGRITCWNDRRIGAGKTWSQEISSHLDTADIILLLVSADFLASNYCNTVEVKRALERHEKGQACVIPVILRPADWTGETFAQLQALPYDATPVVEWKNPDAAFDNIAKGIKEVIIEMEKNR